MNRQHRKLFISLAAVLIMVMYSTLVSAQISNTPIIPEGAPIDGGLSLLVAAGVCYGAKRLKAKRDRAKSDIVK